MANTQTIVLLILSFAFTACGGGGSGSGSNYAPPGTPLNTRTLGLSQDSLKGINKTNNSNFQISGECVKDQAKVKITIASIEKEVVCNNGSWSTQVDLSGEGDGNISVSLTETDESTGSSKSSNNEIVKDTIDPTSIDTSSIPTTTVNSSNLNATVISGSCSENDGNVQITTAGGIDKTVKCSGGTYSTTIDLSGEADGNVVVKTTLKDSVGNEIFVNTNLTKDTVLPTVTVSTTVGGNTNSNPILVTIDFSEDISNFSEADISLGNGTISGGSFTQVDGNTFTIQVIPSGQGQISVEVDSSLAQDPNGNSNQKSNLLNVNFDSIPPVNSGVTNDAIVKETKTWNWSCDSGPCEYRYVVDTNPNTVPSGTWGSTTSTTIGGNGTYYLHLQSKDAAGNVSTVTHVSAVLQDLTNPNLTGLSNDLVATNSKTHNWGCDEASACTYRFVIDTNPGTSPSGGYSNTTSVTTTTGNGNHYLHIQARDAAGNVSAVSHIQFVMDTTLPVISGLSNDTSPKASKVFNWSCDKSPCEYRYIVDQNPGTNPSNSFGSGETYSYNSGNGTYYFHIQARDSVGNLSTVSHISFILDNANPVITGLSNDSAIAKTKNWSWGCTDVSACSYRYTVDQVSNTNPSGAYGASTTHNLGTGDGQFYIHVQARDALGNESTVVHASVTLDNTAPIVTGLSNDGVQKAAKTWNWGCTDANTCQYRFVVDKNSGTNPAGALSATTTAIQNTGVGVFYIHVQAEDEAGNVSAVSRAYAVIQASVTAGSDVMNTMLFTGDGSTNQAISDIGFAPDLVWIKNRDAISGSFLFDKQTGAGNYVETSDASTSVSAADSLKSFDFNGFTLDQNTNVNNNGDNYVSWSFKENSNFMDIVKYTGNGSDPRGIGHNLGSAPGLIMFKNLSAGSDWVIYHEGMNIGENETAVWGIDSPTRWVMNLNNTTSVNHVKGSYFANVNPTTTQFTLGSHADVNANGDSFLAVLFSGNTSGVVKTGNYSGNGSSSGPSISVGFKPKWIMVKRKDGTGDWKILDSGRSPANTLDKVIAVNNTDAEATLAAIDFNASGFQLRTTDGDFNASGGRYIYMAIGE